VKTIFPLLLLLFIVFGTQAQVQPFGIVDTADLKLKSCDFEKDANAEMLFKHGIARYDGRAVVIERHWRIKIFNTKAATDLGDVSITVPRDSYISMIDNLQAETINLENGKIVITKLDKKSFYKQKLDKWRYRITFTFPAMKDGSIIEYKYTETRDYVMNLPGWYFQGDLPIRYSEYDIKVPHNYSYYHKLFISQDIALNNDSVIAMAKVPSLVKEPYMDTYLGNLQHVSFMPTIKDAAGKILNGTGTWQDVGSTYIFRSGYKDEVEIKLRNQDKVADAVKSMAAEQKIAYIFRMVRDTMTSDDDTYYNAENLGKAWNRRKTSSENINLILYKFLTDAGLNASLMKVSSDPDDRVIPEDVNAKNLDETVVYVEMGKDKCYVLDASDKDNKWNEIPYVLLNTYGLYLNLKKPATGLFLIEDKNQARNVVYINADIQPDGKMKGTAQIVNAGYNRIRTAKKYKEDGEKKFTDDLRDNDNGLKIASYKIENMEVDTLPLLQNIDFSFEMPGTDENYIYLNPKLFSGFDKDPFINAKRQSNIDFGFRNNYSINGHYTIPAGYKVDALPKDVSMRMPDTSITFKQGIAVDGNVIMVHYTIDYRRSYFSRDEYEALFNFYKKMYEMLSQPIVLKKG
jgi:hypothetical protein